MIINFAEFVSIIKHEKKYIDRIINKDWQEFGDNALLVVYDTIDVKYRGAEDIFIKITYGLEIQYINVRGNLVYSSCGCEDYFLRYVNDDEVIYFRSSFLKSSVNICTYSPHRGMTVIFNIETDKTLLSINKCVKNYYYLHSMISKDENWSKYTLEIIDLILPVGKLVRGSTIYPIVIENIRKLIVTYMTIYYRN